MCTIICKQNFGKKNIDDSFNCYCCFSFVNKKKKKRKGCSLSGFWCYKYFSLSLCFIKVLLFQFV